MNLPKERVSKIEAKALLKLRKTLGERKITISDLI
ncbi:hypothetical protein G6660_09085 [Polynucleobacter paneuropaeus]|nr:hypothetical protein [Polynucleobacter paneuropaeus]